jgi:pyridine nucleotide-disulfide oxidoreductase domain-containing protein 1
MGVLAAQSMSRCYTSTSNPSEIIESSAFFDIFAHTTHFFGHKVVLLGRFNAQGLLSIHNEAAVKEIVIAPDAENSTESCDQKVASCDKTLSPLEIWTRVVPAKEYVKFTVYEGRLVGALLIGDTNLEEVAENLIMNALDISYVGEKILDPDIDIDDYFD